MEVLCAAIANHLATKWHTEYLKAPPVVAYTTTPFHSSGGLYQNNMVFTVYRQATKTWNIPEK